MKTLQTLPVWCLAAGLALDVVRGVVRKSPELSKLGQKYGPVKLYARAEWDQIEHAMKERERRKRQAVSCGTR